VTDPNRQLLEMYGTEKLAAQAAAEKVPTAVRLAAALLGFGLLMGSHRETEKAIAEAAQLEEISRRMEEERMRATIEALQKHGHACSLAADMGRYMAKVAAADIEIEKSAKGVAQTVGESAMSLLGKVVPKRAPSLASVPKPVVQKVKPTLAKPLTGPDTHYWGRPAATELPPVPPPLHAPAGRVAPPPLPAAATGRVAPPTTPAAPTTPASAAVENVPSSGQVASPAEATAAKSGGGMGLRGKALMAGGLALAGYGALKAGQTAKDYMMIPSQQTQQWGYGARPISNISPFGYSY
jgi:hypothetical protein